MMRELSSDDLAWWMAYYELEPWGEERADWRSANIAAICYNSWKGKGQRPANVGDFIFGHKPKQKSLEEMKQIVAGFVRVLNKNKDKAVNGSKHRKTSGISDAQQQRIHQGSIGGRKRP